MNESIQSTGVTVTEAPAQTPERPSWLPEKFQTPEDLVKSYTALEQKLGGQSTSPSDLKGTTISENLPPAPPESLDITEFAKEYTQNGKLSDETYKVLEAKGLSKDFVDSYIEGQKVLSETRANKGFAVVGGKDEYAKMIQWAGQNLTQSEIEAFDSSVNGSEAQMMLAIEGLRSRYVKSVGGNPQLFSGQASPSGPNAGAFASIEDYHNALRDPKYMKDRAYTLSVEKRLASSSFFK